MTKRILVDAVHPEEIRVAVADDAKLLEFDFESHEKKQIKSNIYLGKITRVEPSLQAAFVEYGGNRQGFLPFSEIHFDYFQIPIEDKEKLIKTLESERKKDELRIQEMEAADAKAEARNEARNEARSENRSEAGSEPVDAGSADIGNIVSEDKPAAEESQPGNLVEEAGEQQQPRSEGRPERSDRRDRGERGDRPDRGGRSDRRPRRGGGRDRDRDNRAERRGPRPDRFTDKTPEVEYIVPSPFTERDIPDLKRADELARKFTLEIMGEEYYNEKYGPRFTPRERPQREERPDRAERTTPSERFERTERPERPARAEQVSQQENIRENVSDNNESNIQEIVDQVDDNDVEDNQPNDDRAMSRMEFYKQYKIQEVIKRNQVVLVQIVKEERGTKGASLTTYLALAGRYCVFMPNTNKGGGVSRRISSFSERRRIRDVIRQLGTHMGTSVIIRTAGMEREFDDIKKDYDYLLSVWDNIRKQTLESSAPALIYEESDIVKRSLRDMLKADVSEVYIEGKETYKSARRFMEVIGSNQIDMLKEYNGKIPIFQKFKIEERLDELYEPEIKLSSGGSIVITPTEALVSIDVNSGKSTKERSVEDTALKTNIEAAREIARQLKLRDLAGLVVIDFIDMREVRNRKAVERELKDALKSDRAKIQIGRISAFGLLEMSRQRLRSSIVESSSGRCPMCKGIGVVRTTESLALKAIRAIEAEAGRKSVKEIFLKVSHAIAHSIDSHRKKEIEIIEKNDDVKIIIQVDEQLLPNQFEISTQKFSSNAGRSKGGAKEGERSREARPQQEVAKASSIPTEAEIDSDVDEQLSEWQKEVADVEKIQTRRYDRTGAKAEPSTSSSEEGGDNFNSTDRREGRPAGDRNRNNNNRNRNNRNRPGGSSGGAGNGGRNNRNNRNRPGGGAQGGRPSNRYNNTGGSNFNGDSFGNEQSNDFRDNYQGNEGRVDQFPTGPKEKLYAEPIPSENNNRPSEDKSAAASSSKLVGLWKKITS